jgi:hypothetical protein
MVSLEHWSAIHCWRCCSSLELRPSCFAVFLQPAACTCSARVLASRLQPASPEPAAPLRPVALLLPPLLLLLLLRQPCRCTMATRP